MAKFSKQLNVLGWQQGSRLGAGAGAGWDRLVGGTNYWWLAGPRIRVDHLR